MTALRSYRDLYSIERNKEGLEKILSSTQSIMKFKSKESFSESVLNEFISILNLGINRFINNYNVSGLILRFHDEKFYIEGKSGSFLELDNSIILSDKLISSIKNVIKEEKSLFNNSVYIGFFKNDDGIIHIVYIESSVAINSDEKSLINIFATNVSIAFNNIYLTNEILDTQKEIIETLSEVVEKRSKETSNHVLRVAHVSRFLALKIGLPKEEADKISMASPLHDIGKTGIPDSILLKPGKLTAEEYDVMKEHTTIGRNILGNSTRPLLKAGSIISYEHHEKWDGSGYPNNKKGEDIHIYGRITAIADVFDALYHKRCYKEAWPIENIIDLIKDERGKHFDPKLVDIFLENIENILTIVKKLS
ncbi:MAG: DUF3369 domain-containing protein [Spirochaetales bacterium]|nr:DUF3369 domain-containing protein [Spirochaetales bacterium]